MHRREFLGAAVVGVACAGRAVAAVADDAGGGGSLYPVRTIPERSLPVPTTVSPELQKVIAFVNPPNQFAVPKSRAEWAALQAGTPAMLENVTKLRESLGLGLERRVIAGVNCFVITPKDIPKRNRHRLLLHVHGGGYVFGGGESGTYEAVSTAAATQTKVISVDYRMPPDHPFPAAMDDAMAVWKVVATQVPPRNVGFFGISTGGAMVLLMAQRAIREKLPLPAAISAGTPWSDLSKTGDSYFANALVDGVLRQYEGSLESFARIYAGGVDLKDPRLSPIYGTFDGFPPTILTTGTRDLFLSNTVRTHRRLRQAKVEAQLEVYEGVSHGQYAIDHTAPETAEALGEIAAFLDRHLGVADR